MYELKTSDYYLGNLWWADVNRSAFMHATSIIKENYSKEEIFNFDFDKFMEYNIRAAVTVCLNEYEKTGIAEVFSPLSIYSLDPKTASIVSDSIEYMRGN